MSNSSNHLIEYYLADKLLDDIETGLYREWPKGFIKEALNTISRDILREKAKEILTPDTIVTLISSSDESDAFLGHVICRQFITYDDVYGALNTAFKNSSCLRIKVAFIYDLMENDSWIDDNIRFVQEMFSENKAEIYDLNISNFGSDEIILNDALRRIENIFSDSPKVNPRKAFLYLLQIDLIPDCSFKKTALNRLEEFKGGGDATFQEILTEMLA